MGGGSDDEVMILSSDEEAPPAPKTLNEDTVSHILSNVTVTRARHDAGTQRAKVLSSASTPQRSSAGNGMPQRGNAGTGTPQRGNAGTPHQILKSASTPASAPQRVGRSPGTSISKVTDSIPASRTRRARLGAPISYKDVDEDPLGPDGGVQEEFDKLESLKEMLAKSSVNITFQGSPKNKGTAPLAQRRTVNPLGTTKSLQSTKFTVTPKSVKNPRLIGTPQSVTITKSVSTPIVMQKKLQKPLFKSTPKPVGKPKLVSNLVVKPVPKLPKIIDRGPVDCFDSLIVETSKGFPCNYCEVEKLFKKRREMIAHMQASHKEELVTEEQKNPDLTGVFPCTQCGTVFHSKFTLRTHKKAHDKAQKSSCDSYYRYYLAFGTAN